MGGLATETFSKYIVYIRVIIFFNLRHFFGRKETRGWDAAFIAVHTLYFIAKYKEVITFCLFFIFCLNPSVLPVLE